MIRGLSKDKDKGGNLGADQGTRGGRPRDFSMGISARVSASINSALVVSGVVS